MNGLVDWSLLHFDSCCNSHDAILFLWYLSSLARENRMNYMQHKLYTIIALLIFALLIQNTCPHGFAGKSTVFASCSQSLHKQMLNAHTERGQLNVISKHLVHMPLFVLEMPNSHPAFQLLPVASPQSVITNSYKKTLPDELLRPPHAWFIFLPQ